MSTILVVGASGQIGRFLLPRLLAQGHRVLALSRTQRAAMSPHCTWLVGDLCATMPELPTADVLIGLGPLDALAAWLQRDAQIRPQRMIAFSSMSVLSKRESPDASERALAERLADAENILIYISQRSNIALTLFRPTLIYGAGLDKSLTPLARFAARYRVLPIPIGAAGLRQPVHAEDLAAACTTVLDAPISYGRTYALGGGERLRFDRMLERVRASLAVRVLALPVPIGFLRLAGALIRRARRVGAAGSAALDRLRVDLVADCTPARNDFDYRPRAFAPDATCWIDAPAGAEQIAQV